MTSTHDLVDELGDGTANARHAPDLESALSLDGGRTQEPTRDLIREAIVRDNFPIGSTRDGYFLIDSIDELNSVVGELERRMGGIRLRIEGIRKGWAKREQARRNGQNWPK